MHRARIGEKKRLFRQVLNILFFCAFVVVAVKAKGLCGGSKPEDKLSSVEIDSLPKFYYVNTGELFQKDVHVKNYSGYDMYVWLKGDEPVNYFGSQDTFWYSDYADECRNAISERTSATSSHSSVAISSQS